MASLISNLTKSERGELFKNHFYLNTAELYSFCTSHSIPYQIMIETENGKLRISRNNDRLLYGCYEKKNPKMISLLKAVTNGRFQNRATARI